ncbi:MAG: DUF5009 domain-containing protein [Planctomycetia bacterium]|nr:DUF5009 domain-containing protein [Planctomycetia bacterium]
MFCKTDETKETTSLENPVLPRIKRERIVSLDALRGFDIFLLLFLSIYGAFSSGPVATYWGDSAFWQAFTPQMNHHPWHGFRLCDLIMPLFLFMTGATIPLSLSKYVGPDGLRPTVRTWWRIVRRVLLLWIFGMMIQGNLLALVPSNFKFYSNTLQAIAAGYFISCLVYLFLPRWSQWLTFFLLLFAYWGAFTWLKFGDYGGGSFDPDTNLAYGIDVAVLGRFRNITEIGENGEIIFNTGYQYTWVFSSLTFAATTLSGMFAGELLNRSHRKEQSSDTPVEKKRPLQYKTFAILLVAGLVSLTLGILWDAIPAGKFGYCPNIKIIWTPSMVLYSSGLSLLLLAFFYLFYDVIKLTWLKTFFVVLGMNAFTAYILSHVLHFEQIASWVLYGLEQYTGVWYGTILAVGGFWLLWYLLWAMYRCGKFLRV